MGDNRHQDAAWLVSGRTRPTSRNSNRDNKSYREPALITNVYVILPAGDSSLVVTPVVKTR
jgi:hypothetical protein